MAQQGVFTRKDGTTEVAHIASPFLHVMFEKTFNREAEGSFDNCWLAYYDIHDRPPADDAELLEWLKQFVATEIEDFKPEAPDPPSAESMPATPGPVVEVPEVLGPETSSPS